MPFFGVGERLGMSGRKSIYGPYGPYISDKKVHIWTVRSLFKISFLSRTFVGGTFGEHVPGKNEHGNLGNYVNSNNFLKMAPQAKPLCS